MAPISPQTVRKLGYIAGEPRSYVRNHDKRKTGPQYEERDLGYTTPCWIFLWYISKKGYGALRVEGQKNMRPAHVVYWERVNGPVPEGLQLDHLCRNRACVNPAHLEPVTNRENGRRGLKPKLTIEQVRYIRNQPKRYGLIVALAAEFGVHTSTITSLRNQPEKRWLDTPLD